MGPTVLRSLLGGGQTKNSYWCQGRERHTFAHTKGKDAQDAQTVNSKEELTDLITRSLVKKMELESKNLSKKLDQAGTVTSEIQTHMILQSGDKLLWRCIL